MRNKVFNLKLDSPFEDSEMKVAMYWYKYLLSSTSFM
jgi:hypothetical protein